MTFEEQLKLVRGTNVLVGVHDLRERTVKLECTSIVKSKICQASKGNIYFLLWMYTPISLYVPLDRGYVTHDF